MHINYVRRIVKHIINASLIRIILPVKNFFYELFHSKYIIITASVNPLTHNWGDDMSLQLCKLINPNQKYIVRRYTWNLFGKDDYLCIGSIITWMTTPHSIIWGSGIVYPNKELTAIPKKILAVRGPLTRQYLLDRKIDCPEIYGDPALLFPRFYKPKVKKRYKLGVIPHFRDKNNEFIRNIEMSDSVIIIDVQNIHPWHKFIDDICSCENIASSSLHGLIISDAYNIPNVWVEFPGGEKKRFAFCDYLLSIGDINAQPLQLNECMNVEEILKHAHHKDIRIDLDILANSCPFN